MSLAGNWKYRRMTSGSKSRSSQGFTLMEMMFVMLILLVMSVMCIPVLHNVMSTYRLRSAAASVTGAIQTTRYQAIASGYPFQLVLNSGASTYQVQSDPGLTGAFANVGTAVPLSTSGTKVTLGADTTLRFRPSGLVTAPVGATTLTLTYGGKTETITVSNYGNVKVTP